MTPKFIDFGSGIWRLAGKPSFMPSTATLMTSGDGLVFYSPAPLGDEAREQLSHIGKVHTIIAPNSFHHLYARAAKEVTSARVIAPDAVVPKQPGLVDVVAQDGVSVSPGPDVDLLWISGIPKLSEMVALHRPSRSLVVADLFFNVQNPQGFMQSLMLRLGGTYGRFAKSRILGLLTRDQAALKSSFDQLLNWDFDRVFMCHGDEVLTGGKDVVARAAGLSNNKS
jgi:hypothetical protein